MKNKKEVLHQVLDLLHEHTDIVGLAEESGVHFTTLYNWMRGKTTKPRLDTVVKVLRGLGYELQVVRARAQLRAVA